MAMIEVHRLQKEHRLLASSRSLLKTILEIPLKGLRRGPAFRALDDVSFEVGKGEIIALIGANGSGKSTLLKLITGVSQPTAGHVKIQGRVVGLLELGAGFHPDLTGRENVILNAALLGLSPKAVHERLDDIFAFADIGEFVDQPVKNYSSGMYVRLGFAVTAFSDADIYIFDEVLAVGDVAFQQKCLETIRKFVKEGKTIFFVSHNLEMVYNLCRRALLLHEGKLVADGPVGDVIPKYWQLIAPIQPETRQEQAGESALAIDLFEVQGEHKEAIPVFETGAPMSLRFRLSALKPCPHRQLQLHLGFITSQSGHLSAEVTHAIECPEQPFESYQEVRIDYLPFMPAEFKLRIRLTNPDGDAVAVQVEESPSFRVKRFDAAQEFGTHPLHARFIDLEMP